MKFFTPQLYIQAQTTNEEEFIAYEQAWNQAVERYDAQLRALLPNAPAGLRQLFESYYLHDARVLALGGQDDRYHMVLELDPPYRTLVLTWDLAEPAVLDRDVLPPEYCCPQLDWLYDEVEVVGDGVYEYAILFSNGWELRLRFRDLQVTAFRSVLLDESRQRQADEAERLGAILQAERLVSPQ